MPKMWSFSKNSCFLTCLVKIFKYIAEFKNLKKKNFLKVVSQHDFQAILAFLTQNHFFSLSQNIFDEKSGVFCHFVNKSAFLLKFDIKNRFYVSFPKKLGLHSP